MCVSKPERRDLRRDRGLRIGVAVDDEDASREARVAVPLADGTREPVEQLGLVGVRREAADRADLAAHVVQRAVDAHLLRAGLEVRAERALALVADEEQHRARVADEIRAGGPSTRPPVSMPFDATIMYGRGAVAIARDFSMSFAMTAPG